MRAMNKSEQAFHLLEDLIERGELAPDSFVSESSLTELTGLGRTPIREAVQRLARNHMVRIHPSKGIEIPRISVEDQLSRLEVRRAVEVLAVNLACERATHEEGEEIAALAATLDGSHALHAYAETVRETHALILSAAHNHYLAEAMTPLQGMSRRFWLMHIKDERAEIAEGSRLHRELLEAIAHKHAEAAKAASLALNDYLVSSAIAVLIGRTGAR